jgi:hypothetical protein
MRGFELFCGSGTDVVVFGITIAMDAIIAAGVIAVVLVIAKLGAFIVADGSLERA